MDANVIATLWGFLALFGVFVALLVPRADENYKRFKEKMTEREERRAKRWALFTIGMPIGALLLAMIISVVWGLSHKWTLDWPGDGLFWLLMITNIAQLAFVIAVSFLVPIPTVITLDRKDCTEGKTGSLS